jgi:DNA-directed RNA polymerase specialized sigma24 family protein
MTKKNLKPKKSQSTLPNNVNEQEFLTVLDNISKRLAYKFQFGYHSFEDMKQQAAIFALEGLEKYDKKRPLENFLWTHVRNRLFNYKRDNYQRPDKPCISCRFFDKHCKNSTNQCLEYTNKDDCEEYAAWNNRNSRKKNIMKPVGIDDLSESLTSGNAKHSILDIVANEQIITLLDKHIPAQYRETYLRLKHGDKVYKSDLVKLTKVIKNILSENNYDI